MPIAKYKKSKKTIKKYVPKKTKISPSKSLNSKGIHYFSRNVSWADEIGAGNITIVNGSGGTLAAVGGLIAYQMTNVSPTASYSALSYVFNLTAIPNLSEYTNMFDQYKILKVVTKIYPFATSVGTTYAGAPNANADSNAIIHYCYDFDDNNVPSATNVGVSQFMERKGYRARRLISGKPFVFTLKPRYLQSAYESAISTAYTLGNKKSWLDLNNSAIPHYGMKMIFEGLNPNGTNSQICFRATTTYYLQFANPR